MSASKASAVTITNPANGTAHQSSPVDFRGEASLNVLTYYPGVSLYLSFIEQQFVPDAFGGRLEDRYATFFPVGNAEEMLDIDGDYHAPMASFTNRYANYAGLLDPPIADGTPLADGRYQLEVIQTNHTDPGSPSKAYSTFWVDTQAPDTVIDTATPPAPTNATSRNFTFHADDPTPLDSSGTSLECRLDGAVAWTDCTNVNPSGRPTPTAIGSFAASGLGEGSHTFEVRARDRAGNVDPTPAVANWIVDLTKPEITINKPAMRERFTLDQNVNANYTCADPFAGLPPVASGIKTCSGPVKVDTSQLGNFRYTVTAEDNAGNTHSVTHSYAVDPPRYADVINANSPIAYYRMGEALGSDPMLDSSGNNRSGEYKNGIALRRPPAIACHVRPHAPYTCDLNADPQDFAAWFPARDGYGFTNGITAPQNAYTLEAWIKRADNGDGSVVGHGGGGQLFIKNDRLALRQTQDTVQSSGPVLTPGEWFHVAATWNGSVTRLYVNGQQVASSSSANKPPSGISTFYVGYGDQAPWFHGSLDEAAYYGSALSGSAIRKRWVVGTARDVPSPVGGPPIQRPSAHIGTPANGGLYAPTKVPALHFHCEDLDGPATVASCTATVDGNPAVDGAPLPDSLGVHTVVVTAVDTDGLTRSHTHTYTVKSFADIFNSDSPIAYYRLGDATGAPMKDSGPQGRDGIFKNDQESGPFGISGDNDRARRFFGAGGYGYVNDIAAPRFQSTLEAWVNPDDGRDQSVLGHGDAGEIYIEGGLFKFRHMGTTVTAASGPLPGRFTQVAAVWDGVTISLYVDGQLSGQKEATKRPSSISTFYVGYGEIKPWFKGSLDEVAYYGKALTPERVLEHFLADPPPGDEPGTGSTDPDEPVSNEPVTDPTTDPGTGTGTVTEPVPDPPSFEYNDPNAPSAESGAGDRPRAAAVRRAKVRKCRSLNRKAARKACLRRALR
jgi:hypothetical protein